MNRLISYVPIAVAIKALSSEVEFFIVRRQPKALDKHTACTSVVRD
jgi:hypothetical protein